MNDSPENRQDLQDCSGLRSMRKIPSNPVNLVYSHCFARVTHRDMNDRTTVYEARDPG
jgi:hypothetical protein